MGGKGGGGDGESGKVHETWNKINSSAFQTSLATGPEPTKSRSPEWTHSNSKLGTPEPTANPSKQKPKQKKKGSDQ